MKKIFLYLVITLCFITGCSKISSNKVYVHYSLTDDYNSFNFIPDRFLYEDENYKYYTDKKINIYVSVNDKDYTLEEAFEKDIISPEDFLLAKDAMYIRAIEK